MTIDTAKLKAAALAATPGRFGDRIDGSGSIKYRCVGADGSLVLLTDHKNNEYGFVGENGEADELFFRLCTPESVLELIAALEAAELRLSLLPKTEKFWSAINDLVYQASRAPHENWNVSLAFSEAQALANWLNEVIPFRDSTGINLETGGEA
ncbi:hypothetical protein ACI0YR_003932 [Cronobacter dublinensis]